MSLKTYSVRCINVVTGEQAIFKVFAENQAEVFDVINQQKNAKWAILGFPQEEKEVMMS